MIHPVTITTPDGVERVLRFTLGARRRMQRAFGKAVDEEFLKALSDDQLPTLIHCCLYDEDGKPPNLSIERLEESYDSSACPELIGALFEAITGGSIKKNEAEESIKTILREQQKIQTQNGTTSGLSAASSLASPAPRRRRKPSEATSGTLPAAS